MTRLVTGANMRAIINSRTAPALIAGYANSGLTSLIPTLYDALDVVSREAVGFLPSVARSSTAERAAVGQTTTYHIAPTMTTSNVTPANVSPQAADVVLGSGTMTITKSKKVDFYFTGEEQRGLNANGAGYDAVRSDIVQQALRAIVNEMEVDLATAAIAGASRAVGTAGTTAFTSGVGDSAQMRKLLIDNGAPQMDWSMVISTGVGAALNTNTQLTKANEAGSTMTLRQGQILDLHGFSFKESAGINSSHTKGTAAGATTNAAGYAVGATTITLASAGTGTLTVGDVITFPNDPNKYLITSGDTDVSNGGTITIAAPGLMRAIPAAATAITVANTYEVGGVGFSKNALVLATRAPARPVEGDSADDVFMAIDPRSGMAFEFSVYKQYRQVRYEVAAAWGWKVTKPEHMGLLLS